MRHVPPTIFPTTAGTLWRAAIGSGKRTASAASARNALEKKFERDVLALVDCGTSALTLAIRAAVARTPGLVAIPGYGCVDVPTAVMGAGSQAVGYDVNATTLAPDAASIESAMARGARVLVVSHLFGHPVDLAALRARCDALGATLIEDAAQWAGARLNSRPLGTSGHFSILSLGRGKGFVGTGGGVLLADHSVTEAAKNALATTLETITASRATSAKDHWRTVASSFAAIALARPALYAIPASIPSLHLGEMIFHAPHAVQAMSNVSVALIPGALSRSDADRDQRRVVAEQLADKAKRSGRVQLPTSPDNSEPGYLRLAVLLNRGGEAPSALGVVRPYPKTLAHQHEVQTVVQPDNGDLAGATTLSERLVTLPVHSHVGYADIAQLQQWLDHD